MTPSMGLLSFSIAIFLVSVADFFLVTRKRPQIFSPWCPIFIGIFIVAHSIMVSTDALAGPIEFTLILLMVSLCALFGYYNMVAFIKRGVTFSIILNHARPVPERQKDEDFIDLRLRLKETLRNGWVAQDEDGYRLTRLGAIVVNLYNLALKLFHVNPVG